MARSGIHPLAVVPRYFDIAAALRLRTDGEAGFLAEVDDVASPLAGLSAAGPDLESARAALARTAWAALHESVMRRTAGVDLDTLAGVRLHLTTVHEVPAAVLSVPTDTDSGRPAGDSTVVHPGELPPGRGGLSLVSAGAHPGCASRSHPVV
jgi:hypothetical protein